MLLKKLTKKLLTMSLVTGLLGSFVTSVQAQDQIDNNNVSFSQDTIVEFEFIRSHGSNQGTFGVINLTTGEQTVLFQEIKPYDAYGGYVRERRIEGQNNTNQPIDYVGTMGNAVFPGEGVTVVPYANKPNGSVVEFMFKKNQVYAFFLESRNEWGQVRSTILSNQTYVQFDGDLAGGNLRDRYGRNIMGRSIAWEDGGEKVRSDLDFDDFVIEAGGVFREGSSNCNCQSYYSSAQPSTYQPYAQQTYYYAPYYYYQPPYYHPYYY